MQQQSSGVDMADPWWLVLAKIAVVFVFLNLMTIFVIVFERKLVARMQVRPGPNRAGPGGWLQSLADGLKLIFKEDIRPAAADRIVYVAAPVISVVCAFTAFSIIPFGPVVGVFGERTALQLADPPIGVLVALACTSVGVYGVVLAGWASGSSYPLFGALRSAAQMISYEVVLGLSIVGVLLASGSLRTSEIVAAQAHDGWFALVLLPSFLTYFIASVGETNRAPFDLAEAESELVGGFHTEYSSVKFMLLFLAEYINVITVCALATTLFLGGWRAPWPLSAVGDGALNQGYWPLLWFVAKVLVLVAVFVWLRGTLPRLRYDQYMRFSWKVLLPGSLVWILLVAGIRVSGAGPAVRWTVLGAAAAVLIAALVVAGRRSARRRVVLPPPSGGFPLPPLDLVVPPHGAQRRAASATSMPSSSHSRPVMNVSSESSPTGSLSNGASTG
ncbi:NADH-quinone oxidoreductase subunit NuoH [Dactylosporangium fulvum]|uniref:NADH-quinone oxidoreductase subunit H n=1 Tax=Dactylosporangium fulvum TaxID=53359 RepID=A0ABY5VQX6_9ACTN|nr:NADH-quinone oxidoreductase subunit NuoH [Dactylosporangium fulvum]UWP79695.1 NADH-quinone oxidoreductase subunit NuoH [Dactylosporangium fulvum]